MQPERLIEQQTACSELLAAGCLVLVQIIALVQEVADCDVNVDAAPMAARNSYWNIRQY